MGLVYWIYCNQTYKSYIGSTIQKIDERIKRHHRQIDCSSKQILDGGNYDIIILEDNINQDILKIREQFYMDCCDNLVNKQRAYRTDEQAYQQKLKADRRSKEKLKWKRTIKYTCECGSICNNYMKHRHLKTKKHLAYLG